MTGPLIFGLMLIMFPAFMMFWNKARVKGKMLCHMLREDNTLYVSLCQLQDAFVIFNNCAYDIYPKMIRFVAYPQGWPKFLQEMVPAAIYDEKDACPLDWINMGKREIRSMEVRAALDENWLRKLVKEAANDGAPGFKLNFKKILPILLLVVGVGGIIYLFVLRK
jgi:hypothetical protein